MASAASFLSLLAILFCGVYNHNLFVDYGLPGDDVL
jgi:hypothetical protein